MPPSGDQPQLSEVDGNKIMHITLPIIKGFVLMGSDTNEASGDVKIGTNISVSINADIKEEADKLFNGLSVGGNAFMSMTQTFLGSYFGVFTDKFEINWMVNFDEEVM